MRQRQPTHSIVSLPLIGCMLLVLLPVAACGAATAPTAAPVAPDSLAGAPTPADIYVPVPTAANCAADVVRPISLPADFAPAFPYPATFMLYKASQAQADAAHVERQLVALVPMTVRASMLFLNERLVSAGYTLSHTDSEVAEADGVFVGHGWIGDYRVSQYQTCKEVTIWTVRSMKL